MRREWTTVAGVIGLAFSLQPGVILAQTAPAPGPPAAQPLPPGVSRVTSPPVAKTAGQSRRTGGDPVDDRVELREYGFKETGENLPYAVFVSSKVDRSKKAPLVLALHGFSGNHGTFMRTGVVDAAEEGGYILVGVMGYNPSSPFGRPATNRGTGAAPGVAGGRGATPPNGPAATAQTPGPAAAQPGAAVTPPPSAVGAQPGAAAPGVAAGRAGGRGTRPPVGGTKETDPAKTSALSEIDTMRVLAMVRKEFKIDDDRIYLMGHSMGGAGALYLGEKYASTWTAIAAVAGFGSPDPKGSLRKMPMYFTAGSLDTAAVNGKATAERLKAAGMNVEWKEEPGLDHGGIIAGAQPAVFKFFAQHPKKTK